MRIRVAPKSSAAVHLHLLNSRSICFDKNMEWIPCLCVSGCCIILWHVDQLLGNGQEISNYTTSVTRQRLVKSNKGKVFSLRSVPRSYRKDKLEVAIRELLRFSRCELLLLQAGSWGMGTVRELRTKGTSAIGNCYQATASEEVTVNSSVCNSER
jgi:hypothetical protein